MCKCQNGKAIRPIDILENMIYNRTKVLLEEYIDKTGEEKKNIKLKYINMLTKI